MPAASSEVLISADSHVEEAGDLLSARLTSQFGEAVPLFRDNRGTGGTGRFLQKSGGWDPDERLKEMTTDGVSAEVLYPTLGLRLFGRLAHGLLNRGDLIERAVEKILSDNPRRLWPCS